MIGSKFKKTGHVTLTTYHRLRFDTVYLHAKFDHSSFSCSGDMIGTH